jgi:hypothetical protein
MKIAMLLRLARAAQRSDRREVFQIAPSAVVGASASKKNACRLTQI